MLAYCLARSFAGRLTPVYDIDIAERRALLALHGRDAL